MRKIRMAAVALLLSPVLAWAEPILIDGPADYRVYQREENGKATIPFSIGGVPNPVDSVVIRLETEKGREIQEVELDLTSGGVTGEIAGVKTGGPYTMNFEFRIGNDSFLERSFEEILVGDLWILAGQSNMEGTAHLQDLETPSPMVHLMRLSDEWTIASDPLSNPGLAVDPVHWRTRPEQLGSASTLKLLASMSGLTLADFTPRKQPIGEAARKALADGGINFNDYLESLRPNRGMALESEMRRTRGGGLGLAFAKRLQEELDVPIGLITNANGGTSMSQWDPELARYGGESLYGSMLRRVDLAGGKVSGIVWYQGEDEAVSTVGIPEYPERMKSFVSQFRSDFGQPELPIVYVQLGRDYNSKVKSSNWFKIQNAQLQIESEMENAWLVPALEESMSDAIHLDAKGLRALGRNCATVALAGVYGKNFKTGPRPTGALAIDEDTVVVSFEGVNGKLSLRSPVAGFEVLDDSNRDLTLKSVTVGDDNTVRLELLYPTSGELAVRYAYGINPITGSSDELGLPVPAFGPLPVQRESKSNGDAK